MDNKYYLVNFCKITGIIVFINAILFGISMNSIFSTVGELD